MVFDSLIVALKLASVEQNSGVALIYSDLSGSLTLETQCLGEIGMDGAIPPTKISLSDKQLVP
jgi:hypothetical protein